jgi:Glycerophosphoryl diester phosphodiesterase family
MHAALLVSLSLLLSLSLTRAAEPVPLLRAHAHNDYEHPRPLLDALDRGFGSIEADIYLVAGQLLVAHNAKDVKPERTLEALYLDPLRSRVQQNGGRVYRGGPTITLLIDVKTEAVTTYNALHARLEKYAAMFTVFRDGVATPGAITVILSGNRARTELAAQPVRYAALDGRIEDLASNPPAALVPWVSDNWQKVFTWKWTGPISAADARKLAALVTQAHAQGRRIRFWNTPDTPEAWRLLADAGVDLINTDHLTGLRDFLLAPPAGSAAPHHRTP